MRLDLDHCDKFNEMFNNTADMHITVIVHIGTKV